MEPSSATVAAYSPCGSTAAVCRAVAEGTGLVWDERDLARGTRPEPVDPGTLVVLGAPVAGGAVPALGRERLGRVHTAFSPCVLVCSYGDRDPGHGLHDLEALAPGLGLVPVAAVLAPVRHVMVPALGAGRPTGNDLAAYRSFGAVVVAALREVGGLFDVAPPTLPPASCPRERLELGFTAECDPAACVGCGACAGACPAGCIPADEPYLTDTGRCDGCMACIGVCPVRARSLSDPARLAAVRERCVAGWEGPHRPRLLMGA